MIQDDEARVIIEKSLFELGQGITVAYTPSTDMYKWLDGKQGTFVFDKFCVSERGGNGYIGIRRKSPHE